jgi:hypothetical protein
MTAGARFRIGVATRGFRGGTGENLYINQTVSLPLQGTPEISVNVIQDSLRVAVSLPEEIRIKIEDTSINLKVEEIG